MQEGLRMLPREMTPSLCPQQHGVQANQGLNFLNTPEPVCGELLAETPRPATTLAFPRLPNS